jgi:lipopolysaccharide/colanic/teichoic acid biosynthesis glycosyltransferase
MITLKRLFDIFFSFLGLILVLPLFLVIAFLIKRESPAGPVFYRGVRVGKDGKPFRMFKFRTMVPDAEKLGGPSTAGDDPRLLKIGHFLKKYQLDELPQLINVLKGEMSLVGPRPEVKMYVDMMTEEEKNIILSVKPGMTDLASLWNFHEGEILRGSPDPEKTYQEKIWPEKKRLQIKYIKERSFWLDLKIILKTILKIFQ